MLLLSPHLDDAVFSLGAYAYMQARAGEEVTVATVFTATVPEPTGFALRCQTDKGFGPEVDYMALRRAEDEAACAIIGTGVEHWGFAEAPHRGYGSAAELFAGVRSGRAEMDLVDRIAERVGEALRQNPTTTLYYPRGWGRHVDHLIVIRAVEAVRARWPGVRFVQWYDQPYVARHPGAYATQLASDDVTTRDFAGTEALSRKLEACVAYRSQIGYQFYGAFGRERAVGADDVARAREVIGALEYQRPAV